MKKIILTFLLLLTINIFSQIAVSKHKSNMLFKTQSLDKKVFENFKKTTTIFTLPNTIDKKIYKEILKDIWTVTPYKIINFEEFDRNDYDPKKYSFVYINILAEKTFYNNTVSTHYSSMLSIVTNEDEKSIIIASVPFTISIEFYDKNIKSDKKTKEIEIEQKLLIDIYTKKNVLDNFSAGLLKNYLQKINSLIINEEHYGYFNKNISPEITKLANKTLYVPELIGYNFRKRKISYEKIHSLFKKYGYDYKIISNENLSKKIMNDEEVYYLYYNNIGLSRIFLRIINAKTGNILYNYYKLNAFGPSSKHIKAIGNRIEKEVNR